MLGPGRQSVVTRGNGYYNQFLVRSGQSLRRLRYRNHRSCRSPLDGFTMGSRYSHGVTLGGGSLSRENSANFSEKGSSVLPNSQERMRRWQSWGFRSWCQQRPCPGPILVADCTISPTIHNRYTFQPVAFHAFSPPVYQRLFSLLIHQVFPSQSFNRGLRHCTAGSRRRLVQLVVKRPGWGWRAESSVESCEENSQV